MLCMIMKIGCDLELVCDQRIEERARKSKVVAVP